MSFLSHKYTVIVGKDISIHRRRSGGRYLQEAMDSGENVGEQAFGTFIQSLIDNSRSQPSIANIALTNPHAHHILLPWNPDILSPSDREAYAQSELERQYDVCADDWYCDIALQRFGSPAIVCAAPRKIIDDIVASCRRLKLRMPRIGSLLVDVITAHPHRQGANALFVVRQHGFCEFAFRRDGKWKALLAMPDRGQTIEQLVLSACVSAGDFPDVVQVCDFAGYGQMPEVYRLLPVADVLPEHINALA